MKYFNNLIARIKKIDPVHLMNAGLFIFCAAMMVIVVISANKLGW